MNLEICVTDLPSALLAEKCGAHRVELCTDLACGGLTPSIHLVREVLKSLQIPVHVLVRNRAGNFHYSAEEKDSMIASALEIYGVGAGGIVSGALTSEGLVDQEYIHQLRSQLGSEMQLIFHRAIDRSSDILQATATLATLPIDGILSSGGEETVSQGMLSLQMMRKILPESIHLMAGGGLHIKDLDPLQKAEISWIHSSASLRVLDASRIKSDAEECNPDVIKQLIAHCS